MTPQDPLAQLRDIVVPAAPSLWPPAPIWWLLVLLVIALGSYALYRWRRHQRANRYRQLALVELTYLEQEWHRSSQGGAYLQAINRLLKRCLLQGDAHHSLTPAHGAEWLAQLDACCPELERAFSEGPGRALLSGPYQPNPEFDAPALTALVRTWLQQHRRPKSGLQEARNAGI